MREEIHNLLKIENDKTTMFTNKELKMIDDYINELEAYKYNLDRDYLRLEKENQELKDNWNYIKKMLKEARQEKYISGYCGTCTDIDIDFLLDKMQELQGSDSND